MFSACMVGHEARERDLQRWLLTAKRPVKVVKHHPANNFTATQGSHFYTLIDSEGRLYLAKNVRYKLPEVIE